MPSLVRKNWLRLNSIVNYTVASNRTGLAHLPTVHHESKRKRNRYRWKKTVRFKLKKYSSCTEKNETYSWAVWNTSLWNPFLVPRSAFIEKFTLRIFHGNDKYFWFMVFIVENDDGCNESLVDKNWRCQVGDNRIGSTSLRIQGGSPIEL